jgi:hypothetical protein
MSRNKPLKQALIDLANQSGSSIAMIQAINELIEMNPKLKGTMVKPIPTEAEQDETLKRFLVGKEQIDRRRIVQQFNSYAAFRLDPDGDPVLAIHRAIDRAIARGDLIDAGNAFTIVEPY